MFLNLVNLQSSFSMEFKHWVEIVIILIEALAIIIIVTSIISGTAQFLIQTLSKNEPSRDESFRQYRHKLAKGLMLGLEVLIAADIIITVTIDLNLNNILILGLLVVVRTFLNWSLVLEIEERWPWQHRKEDHH